MAISFTLHPCLSLLLYTLTDHPPFSRKRKHPKQKVFFSSRTFLIFLNAFKLISKSRLQIGSSPPSNEPLSPSHSPYALKLAVRHPLNPPYNKSIISARTKQIFGMREHSQVLFLVLFTNIFPPPV